MPILREERWQECISTLFEKRQVEVGTVVPQTFVAWVAVSMPFAGAGLSRPVMPRYNRPGAMAGSGMSDSRVVI